MSQSHQPHSRFVEGPEQAQIVFYGISAFDPDKNACFSRTPQPHQISVRLNKSDIIRVFLHKPVHTVYLIKNLFCRLILLQIIIGWPDKTGKNLQAVYGGIRIIDENGTTVQQTGFTYGRPFLKGEKKYIPAFEYIPLREDALAVLKQPSGHTSIVFRLSEIIDESGESVTY